MIVSEIPNRSKSRWLQACVLLCAVVVLPLGIASAQDYEAVAKRLNKAVKKGEITQQHADAMMIALKKEADKRESDDDLEAMWEKLEAMVKAGELTEKQAHAKMAAIKKEAEMGAVRKKIGDAVKAGRITEAQGRARWEAYLKQVGSNCGR